MHPFNATAKLGGTQQVVLTATSVWPSTMATPARHALCPSVTWSMRVAVTRAHKAMGFVHTANSIRGGRCLIVQHAAAITSVGTHPHHVRIAKAVSMACSATRNALAGAHATGTEHAQMGGWAMAHANVTLDGTLTLRAASVNRTCGALTATRTARVSTCTAPQALALVASTGLGTAPLVRHTQVGKVRTARGVGRAGNSSRAWNQSAIAARLGTLGPIARHALGLRACSVLAMVPVRMV